MRIDTSASVPTLAASHEAATTRAVEDSLTAWSGEGEGPSAPTDVARISPDARQLQAASTDESDRGDVATPRDELELLLLARVMEALTGRQWDAGELRELRARLKKVHHPQAAEPPKTGQEARTAAVAYKFPSRPGDAGRAGIPGEGAGRASDGQDGGTGEPAIQDRPAGKGNSPATDVAAAEDPASPPAGPLHAVSTYASGGPSGIAAQVDVKV